MPDPLNASTYLVDRHVSEGRGERIAVTGPAGTLTYAGLAARVRHVAAGLRELGVRPEERVVMVASDSPDLLAMILAVMRIGEFAETSAQAAAAAPEVRDVVHGDVPAGLPNVPPGGEPPTFPPRIRVTRL